MFCHHLSRTEIHITKQPSGAYPNGRKYKYSSMETNPTATVRVLTLQGGETALCGAFLFDAACSDLRGMSPSCCGSSPYPCRSLAYRNYFVYIVIISIPTDFVNYGTKKELLPMQQLRQLSTVNGNRYINRFRRGDRPGRPPNQQLTMCFAGRRACAPYGLCCFKINLQN